MYAQPPRMVKISHSKTMDAKYFYNISKIFREYQNCLLTNKKNICKI